MTNRILIFTEAGTKIGLGHLTRCIALYKAANLLGYTCKMIVYSDMNSINQLKDIEHENIDWKSCNYIRNTISSEDFCIIDSYLASYDIYDLITNLSAKTIYIDDVARMDYPIDGIIVNPSLYFDTNSYRCENVYNGASYVILRNEFLKIKRQNINNDVSKLAITTGGSDIKNLTPQIMKSLKRIFPNEKKYIIVCDSFNNLDEIKGLIDSSCELIYNASAKTMRDIMVQSDLVITAAGQTIYELIKTKTPFVPIMVIDNQKSNVEGLNKHFNEIKVIKYTPQLFSQELNLIIRCLKNYNNRKKIFNELNDINIGNGSENIINIFKHEMINKVCRT